MHYKISFLGNQLKLVPQLSSYQDDFYETFEETPLLVAILTYLGYGLLVIIGQIRDILRTYGIEKDKSCTEPKLEVCYILLEPTI